MYKELHGRLGDRNQKVSRLAAVCTVQSNCTERVGQWLRTLAAAVEGTAAVQGTTSQPSGMLVSE